MQVFKYIKAAVFFPTYAPEVTNWRHKMRGKSGKGIALEFSLKDMTDIKNGIDKMCEELKFSTIN